MGSISKKAYYKPYSEFITGLVSGAWTMRFCDLASGHVLGGFGGVYFVDLSENVYRNVSLECGERSLWCRKKKTKKKMYNILMEI